MGGSVGCHGFPARVRRIFRTHSRDRQTQVVLPATERPGWICAPTETNSSDGSLFDTESVSSVSKARQVRLQLSQLLREEGHGRQGLLEAVGPLVSRVDTDAP